MAKSVDNLVAGVGQDFQTVSKVITFTGAAGLGQVGNGTIFTVTGDVMIMKWAQVCLTDLTSSGAGTISVGTAASTAFFVAATTATDIDAGELWTTATPTASIVNASNLWSLGAIICTDDIMFTVATADVTGGSVRFNCVYIPLSSDGMVS